MFRIILILLLVSGISSASTIGIATGSKTVDGRPLLFKTKDRKDNYPSDVDFYPGTSYFYAYTFQVNNGDIHDRARMGINEVGFGIVYTTSENLDGANTGPSGSEFAAVALKTCETIQSFRNYLAATAGNRDVNEHYAVIDSSGAGSLFEVDGWNHVEIPVVDSIASMANTAKYHPNAGEPASGSTSPEREARVIYLLEHGPDTGLDYRYFINEVMKDFCTTQSAENLMPVGQYETNAVISRYKTAAACVIKGCKSGDNPLVESVMWLSLGEPSFALALPFFPDASQIFPDIQAESAGDGMAGSIDRMRSLVYDYSGGRYADRYADTNMLMQIRSKTFPMQDSISAAYDTLIPVWRLLDDGARQEQMQVWSIEHQASGKAKYDSLYTNITAINKHTDVTHQPDRFVLRQNYPNPFNGQTRIEIQFYSHPEQVPNLSIYDIRGQLVHTIEPAKISAEGYSYLWNAVNRFGQQVGSGIYMYQIEVDHSLLTKKMFLIR